MNLPLSIAFRGVEKDLMFHWGKARHCMLFTLAIHQFCRTITQGKHSYLHFVDNEMQK